MAKTITRIQIAAPANLAAELQAGGTLLAGTPYYYRVAAFRKYGTNLILMHSAATAEVSATPDAANKTIALTWDAVADAYGYAVQRTTTPGSYPVGGANVFTTTSGLFCLTTLNYLTDSGAQLFNGPNPDLTEEAPIIEVYGSANDDIYSYEILDAAIANGWTSVKTSFPAGILAANTYLRRKNIPLTFVGSLFVHDCQFHWQCPVTIINGSFLSASTVTFVSDVNYGEVPALYTYPIAYPQYTNNNSTTAGSFGNYSRIYGTGTLINFNQFHICTSGDTGFCYNSTVYFDLPGNITFKNSNIGHKVANNLNIGAGTYANCLLAAISPSIEVADAVIYGSTKSSINNKTSRCVFTQGMFCAYFLFYNGYSLVDCVFNVTPLSVNCSGKLGYTSYFKYSLTGNISDEFGTPISGAKVIVSDARGLSAIFTLSGATYSTTLNNTDNVSVLTVSNGTLFIAGDIIRLENHSELMEVVSIVGNNLTVNRGYSETVKTSSYGNLGIRNVLILQESITTDVNGDFSFATPMIHKEYTALKTGSITNTLDYLVANGYIGETLHTPHTIIVTKEGYQDYQGVITIDNKIHLEVVMLGEIASGSSGSLSINPSINKEKILDRR